MSRDVMIGLLRKGRNGAEVLAILDAIVNNEEPQIEKSYGTLEPLTFWGLSMAYCMGVLLLVTPICTP